MIIDGLSHPTADGSNGQFLKTDGSGNLSFGTVTSSFTIAADSGSNDTFNTGETLTFTGTDPIDTTVGDGSITISIDTASTTAKGAASFASADFAVSGAGEVTIHSVSNAQLAGSIANAKLANSSITIGSDAVALGASRTDLNGLTSVDQTEQGQLQYHLDIRIEVDLEPTLLQLSNMLMQLKQDLMSRIR